MINQDLAFDEARKRNEQIRHAAEHAFIWMDANETLRKAVNAKHLRSSCMSAPVSTSMSRPLHDEAYPVRASAGCSDEKNEKLPSPACGCATGISSRASFWNMCAVEEVESSKVCQKALKELEKELDCGRPEVEEMSDEPATEGMAEPLEFSDDSDSVDEPPEPPVNQGGLLRLMMYRPSYTGTSVKGSPSPPRTSNE